MWISVVIPTYNRLPILEKCLRALESQRLSDALEGFEVVVVDDGSDDGSGGIWPFYNLRTHTHTESM